MAKQAVAKSIDADIVPRTGERCAYFGECGGCSAQDVAYADQLAAKQARLEELLRDHWTQPIDVLPSPEIWHYRNKVDLNFARKQYEEPPPKDFDRETVLGYNRKGKWYWPLDIEACSIAPPRTAAVLEAVRDWYRREGVQAIDQRTGKGVLRALLIREGRRTGELMVMLSTNERDVGTDSFVSAVRSATHVDSIYRGISTRRAQGAFADELRLLHGAPHIHEELRIDTERGVRRLRFQISPLSFFQTNTLATEVLYREIRPWVREASPSILYDLYGGAGGIALTCADLVDVVRSLDNVPEAAADGVVNARMNGVDNVFFGTGDMKHYLRFLRDDGGMEPNSVAIVDPPRAGMNAKVVRRFVESRPPRFLYVSCNPKVFAQELPAILKRYTLENVRAVDLFPHTPHVELLASFTARRS